MRFSRRSWLTTALAAGGYLGSRAAWPADTTATSSLPWHNWSGRLTATPAGRFAPASDDELIDFVRRQSGPLRPVGAGHSFSPLVPTDGYLVVLDRLAEATIVPEKALTTRDNGTGVFVVSEDGKSVSWRDVTVGIREGDRVQVEGKGLSGRVITLGQQLVDDGSPISIPDAESASPPADTKATGK